MTTDQGDEQSIAQSARRPIYVERVNAEVAGTYLHQSDRLKYVRVHGDLRVGADLMKIRRARTSRFSYLADDLPVLAQRGKLTGFDPA
jgi:hypothetical protein